MVDSGETLGHFRQNAKTSRAERVKQPHEEEKDEEADVIDPDTGIPHPGQEVSMKELRDGIDIHNEEELSTDDSSRGSGRDGQNDADQSTFH